MPDVQTTSSTQSDTRINIHQAADLAYWTQKFHVSVINLKIAVSETNGRARSVEEWLRMKKYIN